ncbi:MAG: hypothetical protein V4689_05315 [Verrucomicrobiota bacterium]
MSQWHCDPICRRGMLFDSNAVFDHCYIPGTRMVDPREVPVALRKNRPDAVVRSDGEGMSVAFQDIFQ